MGLCECEYVPVTGRWHLASLEILDGGMFSRPPHRPACLDPYLMKSGPHAAVSRSATPCRYTISLILQDFSFLNSLPRRRSTLGRGVSAYPHVMQPQLWCTVSAALLNNAKSLRLAAERTHCGASQLKA